MQKQLYCAVNCTLLFNQTKQTAMKFEGIEKREE